MLHSQDDKGTAMEVGEDDLNSNEQTTLMDTNDNDFGTNNQTTPMDTDGTYAIQVSYYDYFHE